MSEGTLHSPRSRFSSLLREFLLIVTGVLTALALENLNASRAERSLEREYLGALEQDLRAQVIQYDGWLTTLDRHASWTDTIWTWANGADPQPPVDVERVLLWLRLGGQIHLDTRFQDGAYQDLLNSGKLALIRDRALREALVDYANYRSRWSTVIESNGSEAARQYTAAVAGVIPAQVAWLAATTQDLSSVDLNPVLLRFRSRAPVLDALVGLANSHRFRADAAEDMKQEALNLLALLEEASGK